MTSLQPIVDQLSRRLRLPVLIDDASLRPLAYSAHEHGDGDAVRVHSILARRARPEIAACLHAAGIGDALAPLHVPGDGRLGLSPRWCVPLRSPRRLLGYLWVIADRELDPAEHALLERVAPGAVQAIEGERSGLPEQVSAQRRLRALLSPDAGEACDAAASLVEAGAFRADQHVAVLVARAGGAGMDDASRVLANVAVHGFVRELAPRRVLGGVTGERVVCVLGDEDRARLGARRRALGARLEAGLRATTGREDFAVGAGAVAASLGGAAQASEQAEWACRVAARIPEHGPVALWDELGVYQLLAEVPDPPERLPEPLRALLASPNGEMLVETLEAYLDTAGDAQATAARLFLARGSLYYRLHRIEEIAGLELSDGSARLTLHLGLKLARLAGIWSPAAPAALERVAS